MDINTPQSQMSTLMNVNVFGVNSHTRVELLQGRRVKQRAEEMYCSSARPHPPLSPSGPAHWAWPWPFCGKTTTRTRTPLLGRLSFCLSRFLFSFLSIQIIFSAYTVSAHHLSLSEMGTKFSCLIIPKQREEKIANDRQYDWHYNWARSEAACLLHMYICVS